MDPIVKRGRGRPKSNLTKEELKKKNNQLYYQRKKERENSMKIAYEKLLADYLFLKEK